MKSLQSFLIAIVIVLIVVSQTNAADTIWNPQRYGTLMSEHVHNHDRVHRRIQWQQHGGFSIAVDDDRTYDNWVNRDDAPRVKLNLEDDLLHLRASDFVIQSKITIHRDHGDQFQAGIYIGFGPNNLIVFGPHGSTRLRLRGTHIPSIWEDYSSTSCYVKLKRHGNEYTAWYSEKGNIWERIGVVWSEHTPTDVGAILKTWGEPRAEKVEFAHFDITHVEDVLSQYQVNDDSYADPANAIHFIYDLSGIKIPVNVYVRDADGNTSNNFDQKMYAIHGSENDPAKWPLRGYSIENFHDDMNCPTTDTRAICNTDLLIVSPQFNYHERHPIFGHRMRYRSLEGEEDWMLIDIHENFIRERFPASTRSGDDRFFLVGQSAGGQFVNRFILTHPSKLEAAITRAAGRVTFPYQYDLRYAELDWSQTTRIRGNIHQRNPRLEIDLDGVKDLRFAVLCGDNDNCVYFAKYLDQPGVASHVDGARKWIRQLERRTGGLNNNSHLFLVPGEGHGYINNPNSPSREFTFDFFFGPGTTANMTDWPYSFSLSDKDESILINSDQVPDEIFHYTRFQKWTHPAGHGLQAYDLNPSGNSIVRNKEDYEQANTLPWSILRSSNGKLGLRIGTDVYDKPKLHYGRLFFVGTVNRPHLEQTAFVTPTFINDWVVGTTFNLYTGTTRDSSGPIATASPSGPFRLRLTGTNEGDVLSASLTDPAGTPYREPRMQRWQFDPVTSLLHFTNTAGDNSNRNLRIGEWRWGYRPNGTRFVAGINTHDRHNGPHVEIQTDATFQKRYFEQWDMGVSNGVNTWLTAANAPEPTLVDIDEMVAYYPFDGNNRDQSGNGHHATSGTDSYGVGHIGQCMLFDGVDDRVQTPLDINPNVYPEMTISVWVRPQAVNGRRQVFSHDDGGFDRSLLIQNGKWALFNGGDHLSFNLDVKRNLWQHVVAIFSRSGTSIYVNANFRSGRPSGTGTSNNSMLIGNNPDERWNEPFHGSIDEVRIYDRALNIEEVWELYSIR